MSQGGRGQYGQPGALTSLGAVGGPRGTGAALTRIGAQFVIQYSRGNLEQIASDLKKLQTDQVAAQNQLAGVLKQQQAEQESLNRAANGKILLDQQSKAELAKLLEAQKQVTAEINLQGRAGTVTTTNLLNAERSFKNVSNVSRGVTLDIINQAGTQRSLNTLLEQRVALEQRIAELQSQQGAIAKEQIDVQQALKGIGSLAIGAIGGTVGGFLLGTLAFQPVQAVLDSLKDHITELLDPMEAAKESAKELGAAVNQIADDEDISRLAAAQKLIERIASTTANTPQLSFNSDDSKAVAAAQAERLALDQELVPVLKQELDLIKSQGKASAEVRDVTRDILVAKTGQTNPFDPVVQAAYILSGNYVQLLQQQQLLNGEAEQYTKNLEDAQRAQDALVAGLAAAQALTEQFGGQALDQGLAHYTKGVTDAADATITGLRQTNTELVRNLHDAETAQVRSIQRASDARIRALEQESQRLDNGDTRSGRTKALQAQINALSTQGPSEAVKRLTSALDGLRHKQAEILAQRKEIADAEKIDLLQLQERLSRQGAVIDIERYSGRERIVAIKAQLDLLQKQVQQQQTLNDLLTAQANIAKGITRNTGESIQDFLTRRAEFYRTQLTNAAKAQADQQSNALKTEQDRLQTIADLHDAEVKQQQDREDAMYAAREKRLQKELAAQQKADQIALTKHRQVLEEELRASQKADANALEAKRQQIQNEIAAERQHAQDQIDRERRVTAATEALYKLATDTAIDQAQRERDSKIQAQKDYVQALKNTLSKSDTDQQVAALAQAKTLGQIMEFAGSIAGSGYSAALLRAQGQTLGLQDYEIDALIANADRVHLAYQQALDRYKIQRANPSGDFNAAPHAKGFVFPLGNQHQSSPFGMNIRHGEGSEELGVILSNKVTQALRDTSQNQPLFGGDFVYNGRGGDRREAQRIRRELEGIVDDKLAGRRPTPSRTMHVSAR